MNYLICDLNIQQKGHYIGYNQYIINGISEFNDSTSSRVYSFLYNKEAKEHLEFPDSIENKVHFLDDNCWKNLSLKEKIILFKKVVSVANELKTDHLIFMDLDQYQAPIFLTVFSFKLSGILFRPHHRITYSSNTFSSKISSRIQRAKKIFAEKLLVSKKQVENIYILNDEEGVSILNKHHHTNQFKYLLDPIFSYPSALKTTKESGVFRFLIFGSINERKNITAIINAYEATDFNIATELFIVGSAEATYVAYLNNLIADLKTINDYKRIIVKAGFVTNEEMDNYFDSSDVCLLIYKDFYGSSGLLGRASLHKKKVVGANVGLLKELIEQNKLGITCDPKSEVEISKALNTIVELNFKAQDFESFYQKYSPENFLKTLLQ